jgi:NAD(P)-dependent dehydrogenase (short-subunit alcohol dehydrogenase family)
MKIAVTGHTKGIGKAIADLYYTDEVVGFSSSNGYDLSDSTTVDKIITSSINCDIFVNNAYHGTAQVDIFEKLLTHWNNDPTKTIVNINSRTIYNPPNQRQYTADKKLLRGSAVTAIRDFNRKCRIININPGYVKTDMTSSVHDQYKMLTPEQLAQMIKWCLDQPQGIEVGELSVWCTTLD